MASPPRRLPRFRLLTALLAALVAGPSASGVITARADMVPWGTVLVAGGDWAGSASVLGDLNVYSNGDGNEDQTGPYGLDYECVELAQRWAALRFGEQRIWPVATAVQMWDAAPHLRVPFAQLPNGSNSPPQFGDLLIFGTNQYSTTGHVAVVSGTGAGYVDIVEQNWNNGAPTGRARLPINGTVMPDRGAFPIIGWLRGPQPGYWLAGSDGRVYSFGGATFVGDMGGQPLARPVVGIAGTPTGFGYWMDATDGGVFAFGDAHFFGSTGAMHLNQPILGMAATPTGKGYWLVAADGGIFSFGDAAFHGSTGAMHLNKPVVGMAATPDGGGYWLVASDGGIFSFGDAPFYGSTGALRLNRPIVGMAPTADGKGYWLVASDGGIFSFGDAAFHGSTGALVLNQPIVGMAPTATGQGYWLTARDGGIFTFGDAAYEGSTGARTLPAPIVGMAAAPAKPLAQESGG